MQVNGTEIHLEAPISLQDFLTQQGYSMHQIAVERNGAIVPRATYAAVTLRRPFGSGSLCRRRLIFPTEKLAFLSAKSAYSHRLSAQ